MALLHATQFYSGTVGDLLLHTLYTVPAGNRIIVRDVTFQNAGTVASDCQFRVGGVGTIRHTNLAAYGSASDHDEYKLWLVLPPAATIQFQRVTGNGVCVITVSGSIYTI